MNYPPGRSWQVRCGQDKRGSLSVLRASSCHKALLICRPRLSRVETGRRRSRRFAAQQRQPLGFNRSARVGTTFALDRPWNLVALIFWNPIRRSFRVACLSASLPLGHRSRLWLTVGPQPSPSKDGSYLSFADLSAYRQATIRPTNNRKRLAKKTIPKTGLKT